MASVRAVLLLPFLWALGVTAQTQQQLYIFNITTPIDGLSSTCIQVLNQAIACDPMLLSVDSDNSQSDDTLASVCGTTCTNAWSTYLRRVTGACGTSRYDGGNGLLYLPLYNIEPVYEKFQSMCLKNSAGKYCNAVMRDALGIDPIGQTRSSGLPELPATAMCDGCFFSSLAQVLGMPYSSAPESSTVLSKLQVTCKTTIAVTSPTKTTWSIPASTTPPATGCQGKTYTIKSGDTCQSIAMAQGFSTTQLLEANSLVAYCRSFPKAGSTICIPDRLKCKPYAPRLGDTCNRIAAANEVSFAQIVSWNPEVGELCGNIAKVIDKAMVLCISAPGGAWVDPFPVTSTSTSKIDTIFTMTGTAFSNLPSATAGMPLENDPFPNLGYTTPFANGSRMDCHVYATPPVLLDPHNGTWSYSCEDVAKAYGITVTNLLDWNPDINATSGTASPCVMLSSQKYCVQPTFQNATGIVTNCSMTAVAEPRFGSCKEFAGAYNITTAALAAWNSGVNATSCSGYGTGTSYCVAASHFKSPDTTGNCAYWATADRADLSLCPTFEAKYKLEHARFVAWNPSLGSNCTGAVRGYDLCVGIPSFHPGFP